MISPFGPMKTSLPMLMEANAARLTDSPVVLLGERAIRNTSGYFTLQLSLPPYTLGML